MSYRSSNLIISNQLFKLRDQMYKTGVRYHGHPDSDLLMHCLKTASFLKANTHICYSSECREMLRELKARMDDWPIQQYLVEHYISWFERSVEKHMSLRQYFRDEMLEIMDRPKRLQYWILDLLN